MFAKGIASFAAQSSVLKIQSRFLPGKQLQFVLLLYQEMDLCMDIVLVSLHRGTLKLEAPEQSFQKHKYRLSFENST